VEQHGNNPAQSVIAVIPARFAATRLRGKLLLDLGGLPLIVRTLRRASIASNVDRVMVATDDARIAEVVERFGGEAVMTRSDHPSGTDRIAEVAERLLAPGSIIVNVQGDEPLIPPATIEAAVAAVLGDDSVLMATTCEPISVPDDVVDPNVVKVVCDARGDALYFSRAAIPFPRHAVERHGSLAAALAAEPELLRMYRKHTGLYVYRRETLLELAARPQSALESSEMLEQLRALESGTRIRVVEVAESSIGVDTESDLERARREVENE